jgi:hypothetical protein
LLATCFLLCIFPPVRPIVSRSPLALRVPEFCALSLKLCRGMIILWCASERVCGLGSPVTSPAQWRTRGSQNDRSIVCEPCYTPDEERAHEEGQKGGGSGGVGKQECGEGVVRALAFSRSGGCRGNVENYSLTSRMLPSVTTCETTGSLALLALTPDLSLSLSCCVVDQLYMVRFSSCRLVSVCTAFGRFKVSIWPVSLSVGFRHQ